MNVPAFITSSFQVQLQQLLEIHLAKIDNDRAKIGIEAPTDYRIFRKEVYDVVLQSNSAAQCDTGSFDKNKLLRKFLSKLGE